MLNRNGSYLEYFQLIQSPLLGSVTVTVGGALIVTNSTLAIDNFMFDRNSASVGGAVFIESKSKVSIKTPTLYTFNHATGCHRYNSCLMEGPSLTQMALSIAVISLSLLLDLMEEH